MSLAKMYLNVNLTPPTSGNDSACTTPKTPEILNSILSLTNGPNETSYTQCSNQVTLADILSPASSIASPKEEWPSTSFTTQNTYTGLPTPTSPPGSLIPTSLETKTAQSPPTELASPVQPVEATKSALIKEGLKHQIRWKMQTAGLNSHDLLSETPELKEEVSLEELEHLTPEDEERRRRRRERNKLAATKCRNKKKAKTCILLSESEDVEDENVKLKSEIQRLLKEKMKLEKLLSDPSHTSSCRHACASMAPPPPPAVVISPPETGSPPQSSLNYDPSSAAYTSPCTSYSIPFESGLNSSKEFPYLYNDPIQSPTFPERPGDPFGNTESIENELAYGLTDDLLASDCDRLESSLPPPDISTKSLVVRRRHLSESRFNPYQRPESDFDMSPPAVHTPSDEFVNPPSCGQMDNHYSIDISQNQYYNPCSYEGM